MSFIKQIISWKKVIIVDIWTYKIKIALCEYKNSWVQILDFAEKKQETKDILLWEIADIEWVSYTIKNLIQKINQKNNFSVKDIVVNIPTSTLISISKNIKYQREKKDSKICLNELDDIIWKIEYQSLVEARKEINQKTWYLDVDMKLITSSIVSIIIDNFKVSNPIWFSWKEINISTMNIFIPYSRYKIIKSIWENIWKNILSIIPHDFSIPKIFETTDYKDDDIIFIDIWNSKTTVIIQKKWTIIWNTRLEIWLHDLIKNIKNSTTDTTVEIINNIWKEDFYINEKKDFLNVWESWFIVWIKEIINSSLVPYKIYISWWWDNLFLREHIKDINLNKYSLHSIKPFHFIELDFKNDLNIISNNDDIFCKTNIALLSMIISTKEIINIKNNPILSILKNFLQKNEF